MYISIIITRFYFVNNVKQYKLVLFFYEFKLLRTFSAKVVHSKRKEFCRFTIYCAYALGLPFLLTLMLYTLKFYSDLPDHWKAPFSEYISWFNGT